jgi:ribonuclease P protein component
MQLQDNRLKKAREFQGVFARGKGFREGSLLLKVKTETEGAPKFGIVISKKAAKQAVVRNRIRRVIKEALREDIGRVQNGVQAAIIVLPGFEDKGLAAVQKNIRSLLKKAALFQ